MDLPTRDRSRLISSLDASVAAKRRELQYAAYADRSSVKYELLALIALRRRVGGATTITLDRKS